MKVLNVDKTYRNQDTGAKGRGGEGMFPNLAAALVDSGPESVNRLNVPNAEKQM